LIIEPILIVEVLVVRINVFVAALFSSGVALASDKPPQQATFVLSQEEFKVQRDFMIRDLEKKIELLQGAKKCAEDSTNSVGFQACNQTLIDGIAAHNQQNNKAKKAEKK